MTVTIKIENRFGQNIGKHKDLGYTVKIHSDIILENDCLGYHFVPNYRDESEIVYENTLCKLNEGLSECLLLIEKKSKLKKHYQCLGNLRGTGKEEIDKANKELYKKAKEIATETIKKLKRFNPKLEDLTKY